MTRTEVGPPAGQPEGQESAEDTKLTASIAQRADIPDDLDRLRAMVRSMDPPLRRVLREVPATSEEVEELRTHCAVRRIALRRREAEAALAGVAV